MRRVGIARRAQRIRHCRLIRKEERLGRKRHARRDRDLSDQRACIVLGGKLRLKPRPRLSIGCAPESAEDTLPAVVLGGDRRTAELHGPVRRLEPAPHPQLDRERLGGIAGVVGPDIRQGLVDDIVVADLGGRGRLELLPRRDDHQPAEDPRLRVQRLQRIDGVAAFADEAVRSHGYETADRRFDLRIGGRRTAHRRQRQHCADHEQASATGDDH